MIAFSCPHCGAQLQAKESVAGQMKPCPNCSRTVQTPAAGASSASGSAKRSAAKQQTLVPTGTDSSETIPCDFKLVPPSDYPFLAPPEGPEEMGRLGNYRIRRVLGTGAMGILFEAQDLHLKRLVALKVMKPALAAQADFHRRFLREAQLAAAIDHEHIVTIYQVGEDRGVPFLAMKLLQGESLEARLGRSGGRLPLPELLRIGREIAQGLSAAHDKGLMHRDIKPANIWLEEDRKRVKIVDFGLARGRGADAHFTQAGAVIGTPSYMAPEQANGKEVDERCDLFSLGSLLYRASTGRLPFDGKDTLTVLTALATKTPAPPNKIIPGLPPAFSDLVMSLLAKDPDERPQSADEIVELLEAIERGDVEEIEEEPASPPPEAPAVKKAEKKEQKKAPAPPPMKKRPPGARKKKRRETERNWGFIVLMTSLVLLGLAAGVLLIAFLQHHRKGRTAALEAPAAIRVLAAAPARVSFTSPQRQQGRPLLALRAGKNLLPMPDFGAHTAFLATDFSPATPSTSRNHVPPPYV
ncbi:MAG TPA: serine/threonine-protein kinase [Gemmataceae bacterium]|nr:serine/threonine-protein kinase [Gemmataceae bacterium]